MPKATVNGKEVEFEQGMTALQVCEIAGEEIPRFCYHERLKIAGNCRMCLVQIEGGPPKPAASCAMPAGDGMVIHTNTPMVKKAREGVMEFLLINHPLDCPICDQGGECDLQDQAMTYGRGSDRFDENKRAVKDKYMGPLIKPHMTRCIHCTRCIRFLDDVAGVPDMGATGRGEHMEVGTFIEKGIGSELSGNIIDLCPVGALTSKPYAFKARSWELKKTESIDVHDAVGSAIRVDSRGDEVMRILPRLNEEINEEWISDKTRFAYDGLLNQRLDRPYVKQGKSLKPASWDDAYGAIAKKLEKTDAKKVAALAGDLADVESMFVLKSLMQHLGSPHLDCRQDGALHDASHRASYIFNSGIAAIEEADELLLIGCNPRYEASLVNTRIRKAVIENGLKVSSVGSDLDLTYDFNNLGKDADIIEKIASGKHEYAKRLKAAKKPMIIVGQGIAKRGDAALLLGSIKKLADKYGVIAKDWNGLNVLQKAAARVGGLDIGFVPAEKGKDTSSILKLADKGDIEVVFLLGADEVDTKSLKKAFVVYVGHHGDAGAHVADVILPAAAYTEKDATYVNLEGRVQQTRRAAFPPGEAKDDWKIIAELAERCGFYHDYEELSDVRVALIKTVKHFAKIDALPNEKWQEIDSKGKLLKTPIASEFENFYMTNPICRASKTMAACTAEFVESNNRKGMAA